jgi:S-adenosylmethionine-diacylglycerol 3-amino-3-carboxypropyl transferase
MSTAARTLPSQMINTRRSLSDAMDQKLFDLIYSRSLVYNTCWEDPAVDRQALDLQSNDRMLVITSAGCNVLDYALTGPARIHAVDANPRQSALLELKLAGIRRLEFEDFFKLFGEGRHADIERVYRQALRHELSPFSRKYWDSNIKWFGHDNPRVSFYYHGLSGVVARGFRGYLQLRPMLRKGINTLIESTSLTEQREIYDRFVQPHLWGPGMNWMLSRQLTMSLLGVPHPQRKEVQRQHLGGVAGFIREAIEYVFRDLPVRSNYFWTLYLRGRYSRDCCPEYLKVDNFLALKRGAADCIFVHTDTVTRFLHGTREPISKFVLLDHMDWMSSYHHEALREEWQEILERAAPDARIIFRSAHQQPAYLDRLRVNGRLLRDSLNFHDGLARALQTLDRVHTYAGFHIADLRT